MKTQRPSHCSCYMSLSRRSKGRVCVCVGGGGGMNTTKVEFLAVGQAYCATFLPILCPNHYHDYGWMGVKNSYGWLGVKNTFLSRPTLNMGNFRQPRVPFPAKRIPLSVPRSKPTTGTEFAALGASYEIVLNRFILF